MALARHTYSQSFFFLFCSVYSLDCLHVTEQYQQCKFVLSLSLLHPVCFLANLFNKRTIWTQRIFLLSKEKTIFSIHVMHLWRYLFRCISTNNLIRFTFPPFHATDMKIEMKHFLFTWPTPVASPNVLAMTLINYSFLLSIVFCCCFGFSLSTNTRALNYVGSDKLS